MSIKRLQQTHGRRDHVPPWLTRGRCGRSNRTTGDRSRRRGRALLIVECDGTAAGVKDEIANVASACEATKALAIFPSG